MASLFLFVHANLHCQGRDGGRASGPLLAAKIPCLKMCRAFLLLFGKLVLGPKFMFAKHSLQGQAKLMELSLVTHVPSWPIGCAWAGHFAWQK